MDARSILRLVARFTGVYLDPKVERAAEEAGKCQPHSKDHPMSFSSHSRFAAEFLAEAAGPLERFFGPYNAMLTQLVHPDFVWHHSDHVKQRLNVMEKAAHKVWEEKIHERKVRHTEKTKESVRKMARQSLEARHNLGALTMNA